MSVPPSSLMRGFWQASYPHPKTSYVDEYVDKLFKEVESAWKKWEKSVKFGGLTVTGAGIGAWSGVGSGGAATAQPFELVIFPFYQNTPQHQKMLQGLAAALKQKFALWTASFTIPTVQYLGSCGASPISPGPFSANVVPTPVGTLVTTDISGIKDIWEATLTPPDFNLTHPQARTKDMTQAVSSAIEKAFSSLWSTTTMISGSTVMGVGTPGAGVGNGVSQANGQLM